MPPPASALAAVTDETTARLVESPNNILAIEYIRAITSSASTSAS
ncbi:MAG: hypothetical protein ACLUEK_07375 [Oscillospiraceae bacterium]